MQGNAWVAVAAIEETPVPHEAGQTVTLAAADAHALAWGFRRNAEMREVEEKTGERLRQVLGHTESAMEAQLVLTQSLRVLLEDAQERAASAEKALHSLRVRYNGVKASVTVTPARVSL